MKLPNIIGLLLCDEYRYSTIPALAVDGQFETVTVSPTPGLPPPDPSWGHEAQWRCVALLSFACLHVASPLWLCMQL